jgi:polar amino acid transport system substrate-binding protein
VFLFACAKEDPAPQVQPQAAAPVVERRQTALERIQEKGELRVAMQVGYAPFEMLAADGGVAGFDVDMAQMIAASLKVEPRIIRLTWPELIPALLSGDADLIMSGMTITPERNMQVSFTSSILETGRMFVAHASNIDRFKNPADLNVPGVFIAHPPGGLGALKPGVFAPKASFREFPDRASALKETLERRAHAYIDEEFAVRAACGARPHMLVSKYEPLTYELVAWAVHPAESHWLNWLNNFILIIHGNGRLDELRKKWFQDYFRDNSTVIK